MRQSRFAFILVTVVLGFAAFILSTCAPSSGDDDEENLLVGTWVNPANDGMGGDPPAKIVFKEDGTLDIYENVADTNPLESHTYTISEQDGNIYKYETSIASVRYQTVRVTSTTLEGRTDPSDYPPSPDPVEDTYTRQ